MFLKTLHIYDFQINLKKNIILSFTIKNKKTKRIITVIYYIVLFSKHKVVSLYIRFKSKIIIIHYNYLISINYVLFLFSLKFLVTYYKT